MPLVEAVLVAVAEASVPAVAVASDRESDRVLSLAETRTSPVRVAARATARVGPRAFMAGSVAGGPPAFACHHPRICPIAHAVGAFLGPSGWGRMVSGPAGAGGWGHFCVRVGGCGLWRHGPPRTPPAGWRGVGGVGCFTRSRWRRWAGATLGHRGWRGGAAGWPGAAGGVGCFGDLFALAEVGWGDLRHRGRGRGGAARLGLC